MAGRRQIAGAFLGLGRRTASRRVEPLRCYGAASRLVVSPCSCSISFGSRSRWLWWAGSAYWDPWHCLALLGPRHYRAFWSLDGKLTDGEFWLAAHGRHVVPRVHASRRLASAAHRDGRVPAGRFGSGVRSPGDIAVPTDVRGSAAFTSLRLLRQGPGDSPPTRPELTLYQNAMAGQYGA